MTPQRTARLAASLIIGIFVLTSLASLWATARPGTLGLGTEACDEGTCVSWVMPSGKAWSQGALPGMPLLETVTDPATGALTRVVVRTEQGETLEVVVTESLIGQSPLKFSFWVIAGIFAALGVAVTLRRWDLPAARRFAAFSATAGVALAVAPAAGGPAPPWALSVQFLSVMFVGYLFVAYAVSLYPDVRLARRLEDAAALMLALVVIGYAASILANPVAAVSRPAGLLYFAASMLLGIGVFIMGTRSRDRTRADAARTALWGTTFGLLPFLVLTVIPEAITDEALVPSHVSIAPVVFVPASFAVAILQHQMLGIRRLLHRGIVYAVTSLLLLTGLAIVVATVLPKTTSTELLAGVVVASAAAFFLLRAGVHRFVDRFIYRDAPPEWQMLDVLEEGQEEDIGVEGIAVAAGHRIAEMLGVDAVVLMYARSGAESVTVAAVGPAAGLVERQVRARWMDIGDAEPLEILVESAPVMVIPLTVYTEHVGLLAVGPKPSGEIFIDWERRLVANMGQVLGLALQRTDLAEGLQGATVRLVRAEERERGRIASDLHDGPLQKALLLAGDMPWGADERKAIAGQLAAELREVCSRLRPSILDDLGLVPALEWLVEETASKGRITYSFNVEGIDEYDRFSPDAELTLFRVTQEALNNILKHARAHSVSVKLSQGPESVRLEVGFVEKNIFSTPFRPEGHPRQVGSRRLSGGAEGAGAS